MRVDGAGVGVAVHGGVGGDDGDVVVLAGLQGGLRAGGDDVQHRQAAGLGADAVSRDGGDGVAGDDQRFDALREEVGDDLRAVGFDGGA